MKKQEIAKKIQSSFNIQELKELCFELNIEYDNLQGTTLDEKVRELVKYLDRRGKLFELVSTCKDLRPENFQDYDNPYSGLKKSKTPTINSNLPMVSDDSQSLLNMVSNQISGDVTIHLGGQYNNPSQQDINEEEKYSKVIAQAEKYLYLNESEIALDLLLQDIPFDFSDFGYANILRVAATLGGRSFNSISVTERSKVEKWLMLARNKMKHNLIAEIYLSVLEIDYYYYHGMVSRNGVSPDNVAHRIQTESSSFNHQNILKFLEPSNEAKTRLNWCAIT